VPSIQRSTADAKQIDRKCADCEEEEKKTLQRKRSPETGAELTPEASAGQNRRVGSGE
jgi:hypothetical protein